MTPQELEQYKQILQHAIEQNFPGTTWEFSTEKNVDSDASSTPETILVRLRKADDKGATLADCATRLATALKAREGIDVNEEEFLIRIDANQLAAHMKDAALTTQESLADAMRTPVPTPASVTTLVHTTDSDAETHDDPQISQAMGILQSAIETTNPTNVQWFFKIDPSSPTTMLVGLSIAADREATIRNCVRRLKGALSSNPDAVRTAGDLDEKMIHIDLSQFVTVMAQEGFDEHSFAEKMRKVVIPTNLTTTFGSLTDELHAANPVGKVDATNKETRGTGHTKRHFGFLPSAVSEKRTVPQQTQVVPTEQLQLLVPDTEQLGREQTVPKPTSKWSRFGGGAKKDTPVAKETSRLIPTGELDLIQLLLTQVKEQRAASLRLKSSLDASLGLLEDTTKVFPTQTKKSFSDQISEEERFVELLNELETQLQLYQTSSSTSEKNPIDALADAFRHVEEQQKKISPLQINRLHEVHDSIRKAVPPELSALYQVIDICAARKRTLDKGITSKTVSKTDKALKAEKSQGLGNLYAAFRTICETRYSGSAELLAALQDAISEHSHNTAIDKHRSFRKTTTNTRTAFVEMLGVVTATRSKISEPPATEPETPAPSLRLSSGSS